MLVSGFAVLGFVIQSSMLSQSPAGMTAGRRILGTSRSYCECGMSEHFSCGIAAEQDTTNEQPSGPWGTDTGLGLSYLLTSP
jgi:hypothetical protein